MLENIDLAMDVFDRALKYVDEHAHLQEEVAWQESRSLAVLEESEFLREYAWVVLCSGFRESVVRRWFPYVSLCYCDWESACEIVRCKEQCVATALRAINYQRKHEAIIQVAERLYEGGFHSFKQTLERNATITLQELPFIGPVTAYHLAKNVGVLTAKPDRHLLRLSRSLGFDDAHTLCNSISRLSGISVSVVDLVLWRFIADGRHRTVPAMIA